MKTKMMMIAALAAAGVWAVEDPAKYVDPMIGTIDEGNVFPGVCRPFGMVQPSPDSGTKANCSGYE